MDFAISNKIFNLVAVLNETFKEIDIDFDEEVLLSGIELYKKITKSFKKQRSCNT